MIQRAVIHRRKPGLEKHYRIVREYCLVGVVTPPYLTERANLSNNAHKPIRIKLCLVVLICIYEHESRVRERRRQSLRGIFWKQMKQNQ